MTETRLLYSRQIRTPNSFYCDVVTVHDRLGSVTTAWCALRLRMEERPPAMEGSCEYIEEAAATNDKGWPSISEVGRGDNNPSP
jgi:hypothetical protein